MTNQVNDQSAVADSTSTQSTPNSRRTVQEIYSSITPSTSAPDTSDIKSVQLSNAYSSPAQKTGQPGSEFVTGLSPANPIDTIVSKHLYSLPQLETKQLTGNQLKPTGEYAGGLVPATEAGSSPSAGESRHPFTEIRQDSIDLHHEIEKLTSLDPHSKEFADERANSLGLIDNLNRLTNQVSDRHIKDDPDFKSQLATSEHWLHTLENSLKSAPAGTTQDYALKQISQDETNFNKSIQTTIAPAFAGEHRKQPEPKQTEHPQGMILGVNGLTPLKEAIKDGVNFSEVRLWDDGVKINQLQNADGSENTAGWSRLASLVDTSHAAGKQVMYTFGEARDGAGKLPPVPTPEEMSAFAEKLAKWSAQQKAEGKGGVDVYEMWNEPSASGFWNGTPKQLADMNVAMMKEIRQYDPTAKIATPSNSFNTPRPDETTNFYNQYFAEIKSQIGLNDKTFDQLDFHGYRNERTNETPEQLLQTDQTMHNLEKQWGLNIPLVDSEDAFQTSRTTSQQDQANLMARQLIIDQFEGVQPGWYAYGNNKWGTMTDSKGNPLLDAKEEPRVMSWLEGANLKGIQQEGDVYVATLERNGKQERIVWTTGATASYDPGSGFSGYESLSGGTGTIGGDGSIPISGEPTLLS